MNDRDDDRPLRDAFARLRTDEARRAPTLAQLRARAGTPAAAKAPRVAWLRLGLPLAGAAAASFAWWLAVRGPAPADSRLAAPSAQLASSSLPDGQRVIALGSLRSPTDALLAPPISGFSSDFSSSLIPAPRPTPAPPRDQQSRVTPVRRSPA